MAPLRPLPCLRMRVWIDLTNSPHVLVMRPVSERLRADGHEVQVTGRDFAQANALGERPRRFGAAGKLRRYEGLKEEYYLADFEPDAGVLAELGLDRERPIAVLRTPPEVSLYHRFASERFERVLERVRSAAAEDGVQP